MNRGCADWTGPWPSFGPKWQPVSGASRLPERDSEVACRLGSKILSSIVKVARQRAFRVKFNLSRHQPEVPQVCSGGACRCQTKTASDDPSAIGRAYLLSSPLRGWSRLGICG
jgi:hypothetical protein